MVDGIAHASTPPALKALGRYELIARLAVGGMAEVFLARQRGLGDFRKLVVVKAIHPHLAKDREFIDMLLDEARISALIKHPNVVDVYDLGNEGGRYFIALEYLAGQTLAELIKAGLKTRKLDVYSSMRIIADVAGGLAAAHNLRDMTGERLELVHRDVSPANIMVLYEGTVKLLDFGVAKASSGRVSKTGQYALKGKVGYMSPEQADAQTLDRRSDIFSLGVVLWELLTHKRLYTGHTPRQVLREIKSNPWVPPSVFRPEVPIEVDEICRRALDPKPSQRYQSALDLKKELETVLRAANYHRDTKAISEYMQAMFAAREREQRDMVRAAAEGTGRLELGRVPATKGEDATGKRVLRVVSVMRKGESSAADSAASADVVGDDTDVEVPPAPESERHDTDVEAEPAPELERHDTEVEVPPAREPERGRSHTDVEVIAAPTDDDPGTTFIVEPVSFMHARMKWPVKKVAIVVGFIACAAAVALVIGLSGDELDSPRDSSEPVAATASSRAAGDARGGVELGGATEPADADTDPSGELGGEPSEAAATDPAQAVAQAPAADSADDLQPAPTVADTASEVNGDGTAGSDAGEADSDPDADDTEGGAADADDTEGGAADADDTDADHADESAAGEPATDKSSSDTSTAAARPAHSKPAEPRLTRRQKRAAARNAYNEALKLLPGGRLGAAKSKLRSALRLSPGYAPAHRALGLVYQKQGNRIRAVKAYRKYLDLAPKAKDADAVRQRIKRLGG